MRLFLSLKKQPVFSDPQRQMSISTTPLFYCLCVNVTLAWHGSRLYLQFHKTLWSFHRRQLRKTDWMSQAGVENLIRLNAWWQIIQQIRCLDRGCNAGAHPRSSVWQSSGLCHPGSNQSSLHWELILQTTGSPGGRGSQTSPIGGVQPIYDLNGKHWKLWQTPP